MVFEYHRGWLFRNRSRSISRNNEPKAISLKNGSFALLIIRIVACLFLPTFIVTVNALNRSCLIYARASKRDTAS